MSADWKAKAATKQESVNLLIPPQWRLTTKIPEVEIQKDVTGDFINEYLTPLEREMTETDAVGIAQKVADRTWTAVQVTTAFCHRAAIAHQLLNCLHEIFFDAALANAQKLDDYLRNNNETFGPLHGVPVSLKDQFHVKGVETHMGYVGWIGTFEGTPNDPRRGVFESEMVRELRQCGAILYCKTSVPHTLMAGETVNNIIKYTWNPKNRYLSAGGSSGGEGALIGFRGSPLGLGTDIGGSIRIPAGFNGLYGLRPSAGRLPYDGMANSMDGQNSVLSVVGPLATTARSLRLMVKSILSTQPWQYDPLVIEMPWRSDQEETILNIVKQNSSQKLAFGVYAHDGVVTPHPPVCRAMEMVIAALQKAGHEMIEWEPPSHSHGNSLVFETWLYDGGTDVHGAFNLSGEEIAPQISQVYGTQVGSVATAVQIAATNVAKRKWQKEYMDYWYDTQHQTSSGRPVDAVICPLAPFAAARPNTYKYYGYSTWVNGLDYSTVVVPVTTADQWTDRYADDYQPLNEEDKYNYEIYDAAIFDGAHVGVQLVGQRFTEEKMIAIGEYVGSLLGK